jgi:hypothetical protein
VSTAFVPLGLNPYPETYLTAPIEMPLAASDRPHWFVGKASRTGCSRPFFKDRACYSLKVNGVKPDEIFVFDGGRFVLSNLWHADESNLAPEPERPKRPASQAATGREGPMGFDRSAIAAIARNTGTAKPRKARNPGSSGKSLELIVSNGGGVIEWTKVPNGVQYLPGGKTIPKKSPVDFIGTVIGTGRAVFCDAKQDADKTAFDAKRDHLKPHQVAELIRHGRAGAISGLLIESTAHGRLHWLPWVRLVNWQPTYRWEDVLDLGPSNAAINWRWVIATVEAAHAK